MPKKGFLWFVYHNPLGAPLLYVFRMRWFSEMMGLIFSLPLSRFMVVPLISIYKVDMSSYEIPQGGFQTVNDFFIRSNKKDFRTFPTQEHLFGSPVDGCIEVFQNITSVQDFCVKGYHANLEKLFGPKVVEFIGGDVCFCRLRFSDYHRFHFSDDGQIRGSWERTGTLYSVDNSVLDTGFWVHNKSHLTHLMTSHFGEILVLEVGATNVGSIIHHKDATASFARGEEKGYFQLGGSAVLLVLKKGALQWEQKIIEQNQKGAEYEVVAGDILGKSGV